MSRTEVSDDLSEHLAAVVEATTRHREASEVVDRIQVEWTAAVTAWIDAEDDLKAAQDRLHAALTELSL